MLKAFAGDLLFLHYTYMCAIAKFFLPPNLLKIRGICKTILKKGS